MSQRDISRATDITNAAKHFELKLDYGPYRFKYYKNGRYLLMGGQRGHVAAMDWLTKDLVCEFNVRETVHAVQWLHLPDMFAVAQKEWVHIYDKDGIEVNVIKTMHRATQLEFLDYYFLLASASDKAFISWKDISIGKDIANFPMKNKATRMTNNPHNGMLLCSHSNGTVSMWTPNYNKPAVSMLCHPASVRGISVSADGNYFATTSLDKTIKIWDLRNNFEIVKEVQIRDIPDSLHFSQRGVLAVAAGRMVQMYKNACRTEKELSPYLRHRLGSVISDVYFCNYEDVLGVGHQDGFTSLLAPRTGEHNFDSQEANPFMSKSQKREMEVKMLLDKIPHEFITHHSQNPPLKQKRDP